MARESDFLLGFGFTLEVQGQLTGVFQEISGLGSENEVVEQKIMQNGKEVIQKVPGRLKFTDVTLKAGITKNLEIWNWRKMVEEGKIMSARKNAMITALDRAGQPSAQWTFVNMWPSKVSGPQFQADSNSFVMEEVTLTFENYKREM
ncbi:MAG: phage tail protein [Pleurocapsa minor GSE-CHR-MK-17-07R]|jgi:phage tail-like protein|nr:phage tail protein [Pleurocapsa minor GSE-CHR-MK 17-07R]